MPEEVGRDAVRRLISEDATVAEVLPRPEYEWSHLAGAIHFPLKQLTPQLAGGPFAVAARWSCTATTTSSAT